MKKILSYLKDTKGSGIVTVMLSILFLTAFGTLALYTTYTSVQTVSSERGGIEATINANTCMDEIRAGVQQVVSDAISATYDEVMPNYTKNNANITESFRELFAEKIFETPYKYKEETPVPVFARSGHNGETITYSKDALEKMVREKRGYVCTISSPTGFKAIVSADGKSLTLKDIEVTYKFDHGRQKNRSSTVTSDIVIEFPDFGYLLTQYSIKGLPSFAIVAKTIQQNSDTKVTFSGNAYADQIILGGGATASMKIQNYSTMVVKNNISVSGGPASVDGTYGQKKSPRFKVDPTSTLWAGNIDIGSYSSATLSGTTYVANDLVFSGGNAYVTLGADEQDASRFKNGQVGYYYGFGYSTTDPAKSSAIIANRSNNTLNVKNLSSLTLAGYSFISNTGRFVSDKDNPQNTDPLSTAIRMGESLSGKQNQLIYFAPDGTVMMNTLKLDENGFPINKDGSRMKRNDSASAWEFYREVFNEETNTTDIVPATGAIFDPQIESTEVPGILKYVNFTDQEISDFKTHHGYFSLKGEELEVDPFTLEIRPRNNSYSKNLVWGEGSDKTYEFYTARVKPIYENIGGGVGYVAHFFLSFDSPEKSNQFFADYFDYSQDTSMATIKNSLIAYLATEGLDYRVAKVASGSFYEDSNYDNIRDTLETTIDRLRSEAQFMSEIFENFCKTLSNVKFEEDENATDPFDAYVNKEKVDSLGEGVNAEVEFKIKDKTVAIITNKPNITIDNDSKFSNVCLIISTGNVTVERNLFKGLILCDGTLTISSTCNFVQSDEDIVKAFSATSGEMVVKDFFKKNITKDYTVDNDFKVTPYGKAYDVSTMVYYKNWRE